jgi:outer membrane protein TolC
MTPRSWTLVFSAPLLLLVGAVEAQGQSFDEVIARLDARYPAPTHAAPRRGPSLRLETGAGISRTHELFYEAPYESRTVAAVVAFDYPLFDGAARRSAERLAALEHERARLAARLGQGEFEEILDAYADLWLADAEASRTGELSKKGETLASRAAERVRSGAISNVTAAQDEESALAIRGLALDIELRQLDARRKLRTLAGEEIWPEIPAADITPLAQGAADRYPDVLAASLRVEGARLDVARVERRRRPSYAFSGYGGAGAAEAVFRGQDSSGAFGIYGLRLRLTFSLRDTEYASDLSRARSDLARAEADRAALVRRVEARVGAEALRIDAQRRRVDLLAESVDVAQRRQQSLERLVAAGMMPDIELVRASLELLARQARLDAARVDQWKAWQRLRRMAVR